MLRKITGSIIAMLAIIATGCNSDSDTTVNPLPQDACFDFATLEGTTKTGSTFTLQKSEFSELVTYTSTVSLLADSSLYAGERLIISYIPSMGQPYVSGPITLLGFRRLDNTSQTPVGETPDATSDWFSSPVKMQSFTRTGPYVNMQMQLYCYRADKPKRLVLAYDSTQVDVKTPELHLIFTPKQDGDNNFTGYASFDLTEIWELPAVESVKITYQTNDGLASKTFRKDGREEPTPGA